MMNFVRKVPPDVGAASGVGGRPELKGGILRPTVGRIDDLQ